MVKSQAVLVPIVFGSQPQFQEETKFHNFANFFSLVIHFSKEQ
jgi:hypothetical protein